MYSVYLLYIYMSCVYTTDAFLMKSIDQTVVLFMNNADADTFIDKYTRKKYNH